MAPKRRRSFPGIPEKKRIHFTPLYLRKIPSSSVPGEAPHISIEEAPPLLPDKQDEDSEDRQSLFDIQHVDPIEEYSKFPGVAAPYVIRIPPTLLHAFNPFFDPKLKDVKMEDAEAGCSAEAEKGAKTPAPKKPKKKKKKSSLVVCKLEEDESSARFSIASAKKRVMFAELDEFEHVDEDEDEDDEWDGKPDPNLAEFNDARRKELSFSHDAEIVHDERSQVSRDSILLAAKIFEKQAEIRRVSKHMETSAEFRSAFALPLPFTLFFLCFLLLFLLLFPSFFFFFSLLLLFPSSDLLFLFLYSSISLSSFSLF